MNLTSVFPTHNTEWAANQFWNWMVPMTWQVAVLVAILLALTWLLRNRTSARFKYALWLIVPIRLVLPPTLALATSWGWWCLPSQSQSMPVAAIDGQMNTHPLTTGFSSIETTTANSDHEKLTDRRQSNSPTNNDPTESLRDDTILPTNEMGNSFGVLSGPLTVQGEAEPGLEHGTTWLLASWKIIPVGIWLVGTTILLLRILFGLMQIRSLIRRACPVGDEVRSITKECQSLVGLKRPVAVLSTSDATTPMLVGLWRPVVLFPVGIEQMLEPGELRTVLVHEFQHVLRRDLVVNFATSILASAYWFHPAVWLAQWQLRRLRELACDEGTVSALAGSRKAYATGLVKVAEMISNRQPTPALGFVERKSEMSTRVMKVLDCRLRVGRGLSVSAMMAVLALGLVLLPGAGRHSSLTGSGPANTDSANGGKTNAMQTSEAEQQPASASNNKEEQQTGKKTPPPEMVVHVVDEEGKPLEDVNFFVNAVMTSPTIGKIVNDNFKSNVEGNAILKLPEPLISARIWASKSGYVTLFFNWEDGDTDNVPDSYSIILQRGTELGGVMVGPDGEPVAGAKVDVSLMGGGTKVDPQVRTRLNNWLADGDDAAVSGVDGRWSIGNAPPGDDLNLRFQIVHPDFINDKARHPMGHYMVTLEELRAKTARFKLKRGTELRGKVMDDEGNPVAQALVIWGDRPYMEVGNQEVLTDDSGDYRIPPQPNGDVRITVVAKDWMPIDRVIKVSSEEAITEDFKLTKGKKLHLKFVDGAGQPIPEVYVGVTEWHGVEALYNHRHSSVKNSQIPLKGDNEGNFVWDWAPDDLVKLNIAIRGANFSKAYEVVANDEVKTIVLRKPFALSGNVVDAVTGQSINTYSIVPVNFSSASASASGIAQPQLTEKLENSAFYFDNAFRFDDGRFVAFRFQAVGYRDFTTERFASDAPDRSVTIRLEPAPMRTVRVLNAEGKPAESALVWIAKPDQGTMVSQIGDYFADRERGIPVDSDGQVQYGSPDTPHAIVAAGRTGYAEKYLQIDEEPGDLVLQPWSRLEGQLIQAGQPVPGASIVVRPIRQLGGDNPHVQDIFKMTTDANGKFVFDKLPPVPVRIRSTLNPWRDYPITSNRELPIELQPGQTHQVSLGGEGLEIVGKVRLLGDGAGQIQLRYGLNTLLRLEGGIAVPEHSKNRIEYQSGEQKEWQDRLYEGIEDRGGKEEFFVKLRDDGTFLISGVQPGKYRFLIKMYEPPTGCLVEPVGYSFLEFSTDDYNSDSKQIDLGTLDIMLKPIPKVGETLPDFRYKDFEGQQHQISELRGKHVMIDFWASWCQPCIRAIPDLAKIQESIKGNDQAMMIGISVDDDLESAKSIVTDKSIAWPVGFAGDISGEGKGSRTLGISTVPTYVVLDPQGAILYRGFSHEEAAKVLGDAID